MKNRHLNWKFKSYEFLKIIVKTNIFEYMVAKINHTVISVIFYPSQIVHIKYLLQMWKLSEQYNLNKLSLNIILLNLQNIIIF